MEKKESLIYGFCFLLGGVFLLIFIGIRLIDLLSKTVSYYMLIFCIVLILYGAILVLIGILIITVNIRVKKSVALIIFSIGILIIILSISVIIVDSFTSVNVFEILSGIGLIFLGIRLFFHPVLKSEGKIKIKKIMWILLFIVGVIISLSYGFSIIMTMVSYNLEAVFHTIPFLLLPFLIGIVSLMFSVYSIKPTYTAQERKRKGFTSILMGILILFTSIFSIISMINHTYYAIFYTLYYPLPFILIGTGLILFGVRLQQNSRKKKLDIEENS